MEIETIISQNPWWRDKRWDEEDRHLKQLKKYPLVYSRPNIIPDKNGVSILYGPRQVGKTTWVKLQIRERLKKHKAEGILYLNAETLRDRFELFDFLKTANSINKLEFCYIDEITAIPDWEVSIKALVDGGFFDGKQAILTGSSSINLLKKAERLPGRLAEGRNKYRFYPLSFREVAELYDIRVNSPKEALANLSILNSILYKYFIHGGFIRAINAIETNKRLNEDLFSVYSAWIDGELAKAKKSPELATYLMDGIANSLTNDISWSALSKHASHPTVANYGETLKDMFVINYLEKAKRALSGNPRNKKVYFSDPFIYWLSLFRGRKLNSVAITDLNSETMGKLAEMAIFSNLAQYLDLMQEGNDFDVRRYAHFEKSTNGKEIDFIVRIGEKTYSLESKYGILVKEREGVIYITKDSFGKNKVPLPVFLLDPQESLKFIQGLP
ncbi:ATP-binding protein [Candidatus Micrarchaeota archaeon]|nr:ATP-binding protein [Candidatus Micrarchaeota archaeon]